MVLTWPETCTILSGRSWRTGVACPLLGLCPHLCLHHSSPLLTALSKQGTRNSPLWPSLHISAHSRSWDGKPRKFNLPSPAGAKEVQPEMETLPDNNLNYMGCLRRPFHCPIIFSTELPNLGTNYGPHPKLVTQISAVSLKTPSCRLCRPPSEWVNCRCSQWALPALISGLETANSSSSQGTARCSPLHLEHRILHSQLFLLRTILMKISFNADLYRQMALPAWVGWSGICSCNYTNITKYVALCDVLFIMWR